MAWSPESRPRIEMPAEQQRVSFGARWRAARPGCGCGRRGCDGCALTLRTVFVLQSELAWLVDVAGDDIPALQLGRRTIGETVFSRLPAAIAQWAGAHPMWLEQFRESVRQYVHRLGRGDPVDPLSLAEEVALRMAFATARAEADPDGLLPPDVAAELPAEPGDYAWNRADEAVPASEGLNRLYRNGARGIAPRGHALHPECWFDLV
jgi:hypothetical protein